MYKKILKYSRLLGEESSGNHQAYRRGHLDITILNENSAWLTPKNDSRFIVLWFVSVKEIKYS